jgi:hypothetical protein
VAENLERVLGSRERFGSSEARDSGAQQAAPPLRERRSVKRMGGGDFGLLSSTAKTLGRQKLRRGTALPGF